jgi:hypothetical protein
VHIVTELGVGYRLVVDTPQQGVSGDFESGD